MLFCRIDSPGDEERSIIRRSDAPGARGAEQNDETIAVRSLSHIQTFYCREVSDVDAASNTIQFLKYSSLAMGDGRTILRHHPTHERGCQEAPPDVYGADANTFGGWGKAASGLPLRQCSRWSQRAHEHTSTRAHEHTSTRAHDTQPIPPQKNLTIRGRTSPAAAQKYVTNTHQDAPPSRATPRLKRRQWARSSPQHTLKKDMPNPPPRRKHLTPHHHAQTVVHYTPNTPCHPDFTEVDCTLSKHSGVLRP